MKIHKGDIAMDMLEDAIDLFHEKRFLSSLHLASASSELLSGLCEIISTFHTQPFNALFLSH